MFVLFLHFGQGEDDDTLDDRSLVLIYRRDGFVVLDEVYFLASTCEDAQVCSCMLFRAQLNERLKYWKCLSLSINYFCDFDMQGFQG